MMDCPQLAFFCWQTFLHSGHEVGNYQQVAVDQTVGQITWPFILPTKCRPIRYG